MSKLSPFDYANTINKKTEHLTVDKNFQTFIINKLYSNTQDSVFYANEANMFTSNMTEQMVYDFYWHGLPKATRYGKWFKAEKDDNPEVIEYVMNYFNYSRKKAILAIENFDAETLEAIQEDIFYMNNPMARNKAKNNKKKK